MVRALSLLIKPASSLCNLNCKYCFYKDVSKYQKEKSKGIMSFDVMQTLIRKSLNEVEDGGYIHYAFQGGEPTLAGLKYFQSFCDEVAKYKKENQQISYSIQTNGILLDDKWCTFLKNENFLVGVSLDGYESNTNRFRQSDKNKGIYYKIIKGVELLNKYKIDFNILTVVTNSLSKHPQALYNYLKEHGFSYVQFIPCLPPLNEIQSPYSLKAHDFAHFYKTIYDLWLKDYTDGYYTSISLFDNLIAMLAGFPSQQCGISGQCHAQLVVESNGNVYPCDFYVLDQYECGNIKENTFLEILKHVNLNLFLNEKKQYQPICEKCRFYNLCHGGCKRQNVVYFDHEYCGYQDFLNHAYPTVFEIANQIKKEKSCFM